MSLILALILTLAGGDHCRAAEQAARSAKKTTLAWLGGGALAAAVGVAVAMRWWRRAR